MKENLIELDCRGAGGLYILLQAYPPHCERERIPLKVILLFVYFGLSLGTQKKKKCLNQLCLGLLHRREPAKDEIDVPIALSAFRDKRREPLLVLDCLPFVTQPVRIELVRPGIDSLRYRTQSHRSAL